MSSNVDLSRFLAATRQLSKLSGQDYKRVMALEAGKILEIAVRYTPKADQDKIRQQVGENSVFRFQNQESDAGKIYTNKGDGKTWFSPGTDKAKWFLILKWKVPNPTWASYLRVLSRNLEDLRATIERRVKDALARRGLAAKTWIQVGDAIGAPVKAPSFVQNATIPDGIGKGSIKADEDSVIIEGSNSSISLIAARIGQGIINRAIRARAKFIEIAIKKGALESLEKRAKSFPHLFK